MSLAHAETLNLLWLLPVAVLALLFPFDRWKRRALSVLPMPDPLPG